MSTFVERDITCPHCGEVSRRTIAESLNPERIPLVMQKIMDGTFQVFTCERCNQGVIVDHPLMVIDFAKNRWIAMYPRAWEARWRDGERESDQVFQDTLVTYAPPIAREMGAALMRRVVFGLDALREKLVLLDAGLDDRWLELLKLEAWRGEPGLRFAPDARPRLFFVGPETLDFNALGPDGQGIVLRVQRARYDALLGSDDEVHRAVIEGLADVSYVDLGRVLTAPDDAAAA